MRKYLLTEEQAYERTRFIDALQVGDDLYDAVHGISSERVTLAQALVDIKAVRDQLNAAIEAVEALDWPLRR